MRRSWAAIGKTLLFFAAILWVSGFGALVACHEHDEDTSDHGDHAPTDNDHGQGCTVCVAAAAMLGAEAPSPVEIVGVDPVLENAPSVPASTPLRRQEHRLSSRDPPLLERL